MWSTTLRIQYLFKNLKHLLYIQTLRALSTDFIDKPGEHRAMQTSSLQLQCFCGGVLTGPNTFTASLHLGGGLEQGVPPLPQTRVCFGRVHS